MNIECELKIYNQKFELIGIVKNAESVILNRDIINTGNCIITININKEYIQELTTRNNIIMINNDLDKVLLIEDFIYNSINKIDTLTIYCITLDAITKSRQTYPSKEMAYDNYLNIEIETIIKSLITKNLINADDKNRNIPYLINANDKKRGAKDNIRTRFLPLDIELAKICEYAKIGYKISLDLNNKKFVFDTIFGNDLTEKNSNFDPVIFKLEYSNITDFKYEENFKNFKNVGILGGKGDLEKRLIYYLNNDIKGIERKETFIECNNADNLIELISFGKQKIIDFNPIRNLDLNPNINKTYILGIDYNLGDFVTIFISKLNIKLDLQITKLQEVWESGFGYKQILEFGKELPELKIEFKNEDIR